MLSWNEEIDDLFETHSGTLSDFTVLLDQITAKHQAVVAFTDGSYYPHNGRASFAVYPVSLHDSTLKKQFDSLSSWYPKSSQYSYTNYAMEAMAVCETLDLCIKLGVSNVMIYSDCLWLIQSLTRKNNNDSKITDPEYHKIVLNIKRLASMCNVSFGFIPSHSKDANSSPFKVHFNNIVDQMCSDAYRNLTPSSYPSIHRYLKYSKYNHYNSCKNPFYFYPRDPRKRFGNSKPVYSM